MQHRYTPMHCKCCCSHYYAISLEETVFVDVLSLFPVFVLSPVVTVVFSSFFLSSPQLRLSEFYSNSRQLLLSFAVVFHSPFTPSRYLLTQFVHRMIGLRRHLISLPVFHLPFFPHERPISTCSAPISF